MEVIVKIRVIEASNVILVTDGMICVRNRYRNVRSPLLMTMSYKRNSPRPIFKKNFNLLEM
jgi:hypothetical protein